MDESFDGAGAGSVVIIGFGRFGQIVTQTMLQQRIEVTVIDKDVESIQAAARFGFRIYYGDGTRLDVLRAAGVEKARLVALCVDDQKGRSASSRCCAPSFRMCGSSPAPTTGVTRSS